MTRARRRAFAVIIAIAVAALLIVRIARQPEHFATWPPSQRPRLLLLTSLPLLFSEDFSLQGGGSLVLRRLSERFRVVPISVTAPSELAKGQLLLMAQPFAQTGENLVALDDWVRGGGHVLLLADPMLEWPSKRPLGDLLRPPPMFMDTGLLGHWGLRLDAPDKRGPVARILGGETVVTVSPGRLSGSCDIDRDGLVARCRIGKGRAIVVADADFLNLAGLGNDAEHNLDALLEELARLEQR